MIGQPPGAHSRNYQNQLGASNKTQTESMVYGNNSIGSSFNHGFTQNPIHNRSSQNKANAV